MKRMSIVAVVLLVCAGSVWAQEHFGTSLHATRAGKQTWYGAENGGFESLTGVPVETMGCVNCHGATNALGEENGDDYEPGCNDCHAADFSVQEGQCLSCHARQAVEAVVMKLPDVHREAGMVCWDCHSAEDLHGDGNEYASQFEPGAIKAACEDCHDQPVAGHEAHDPHEGKLACESCHATTVIACYNCHLESLLEGHNKRHKQPLRDFVILVNRARDGKVAPASFQSLTYQGKGWLAMGPYSPHTITREGRTCTDCHVNQGGSNEAIEEYNATGQIKLASLADDGSLSWVHGVVPLPADFETSFKMDFITYDGAATDPVAPSSNWSRIGKDTPDGQQLLYATPLTPQQMASLGFTGGVAATAVTQTASVPADFALDGSYPNPFNSTTTIAYHLDRPGAVRLAVFDAAGRRLVTLVDTRQGAGSYQAAWNGKDAAGRAVGSGLYLARLSLRGRTLTTKMMLLK